MTTFPIPEEDLPQAQTPPDIAPERYRLMRALTGRRLWGTVEEVPEVKVPISIGEARAFALSVTGLPGSPAHMRLSACWDFFRHACTAEQFLSYQRLINALAIAVGMESHKAGARICAENRERYDQKAEAERMEQSLHPWRRFASVSSTRAETPDAQRPPDPQVPAA